ncbi:MAG TPA: polyprenol monophosphomannose synthase, partial [Nitrososphaeraceae archaeon]|nr:polyprenol monophosphomannose synthase [Nitrososphaeraceae archaeon]
TNHQEIFKTKNMYTISIIIPTYNESENIIGLLDKIKQNLPQNVFTEIIIVDDNSPDGTGRIVQEYIKNDIKIKSKNGSVNFQENQYLIKIINRKIKNGLIPAILEGVKSSKGDYILIMDADFSHPPEIIPKIIEKLLDTPSSIVIASRYTKDGSIVGWPFKRRLISKGAAIIAKFGLNVNNVTDPMSGFFAVPRDILENIKIDTKGYKILLEILVKSKNIPIFEIPYTFLDRKSGKSKMGMNVIVDYVGSVWQLYRYGQRQQKK